MTRKKYNKGRKESLLDKNLRLDPNVLKGLSQKQMVKYALENLRNVLTPLYSATYDDDCYVSFVNYPRLYDFVNAQIDKITRFLLLNYGFYVKACEVTDGKEYFERVKNLSSAGCCNAILELEFSSDEVPSENTLAQIIAESFFDELDKLFKISIDNIIYDLDEFLDMSFNNKME